MFCFACASANPSDAIRCSVCGERLPLTPGPRKRSHVAGWTQQRAVSRRQPVRRAAGRLIPFTTVFVLLTAGMLIASGLYARSQQQAVAYAQAAEARASGALITAQRLFAEAGDFRDAPRQLLEVRKALRPYDTAFAEGEEALAAGMPNEAVAAFLKVARELPDYPGVLEQLEAARSAAELDALRRAQDAIVNGDWLVAEAELLALLAVDPDNETVQQRLAEIQRNHAPIVFTRDHQLIVTGPDGREERVLAQGVAAAWPIWSPDRRQIAFLSPDGYGGAYGRRLYVINADGTSLRELAAGLRPYAWPVWSPDGQWIAYTVEGSVAGPYVQSARWIQVVNVETGQVRDLKPDPKASAFSPVWSPLGDRLAFIVRGPRDTGPSGMPDNDDRGPQFAVSDVWIWTMATGEMQPLTDGELVDPRRLAWSPTSEQIAVWSRFGSSFQRGRITLLDAGTGAITRVTAGTHDVSPPAWSPDGTRLAFVVDERGVRIIESDGGMETYWSEGWLSRYISWAPSGDALIIGTEHPRGEAVILTFEEGMPRWSDLQLHYDQSGMYAGPPQWSSWNPVALPGPPTLAGTALDPGPVSHGVTSTRNPIT